MQNASCSTVFRSKEIQVEALFASFRGGVFGRLLLCHLSYIPPSLQLIHITGVIEETVSLSLLIDGEHSQNIEHAETCSIVIKFFGSLQV